MVPVSCLFLDVNCMMSCFACHAEFVPQGTLNTRLMDLSVELPWKLRIRLAKDVACGMVRDINVMFMLHC